VLLLEALVNLTGAAVRAPAPLELVVATKARVVSPLVQPARLARAMAAGVFVPAREASA